MNKLSTLVRFQRSGSHLKPLAVSECSGFTLIELLLVLAVIALLAALLVPVFFLVRGKANMTACASNLHQLHTACALYAADYDSFMPDYTSRAIEVEQNGVAGFVEQSHLLVVSLHPYTRSDKVWICPADSETFNPRSLQGDLPVPHVTSYWYYGIAGRADRAIRSMRIDHPDYGKVTTVELLRDDVSRPCDLVYQQYNHNERINAIYLDGHLKNLPNLYEPACP